MVFNVYSIFDNKARCFSRPFFAVNADVATRSFGQVANDLSTEIGRHPTDFTLFCIGSFDDELGTLWPLGQNENLGLATMYKSPEVANAPQS